MRVFVALAKTESLRQAADILNLTPSAVSKIYRQVEAELGVPLLVPLGRGLTLTLEGRQFALQAEKVLTSFDELKGSFRQASSRQDLRPLKIATFEVFSTYFLQTLSTTNLQNRKLMLYEALPGEVERAVRDQQADFGITYMPIPFPEVEHVKITKIEMGTFCKKGSFAGMALEDLPYVVPVIPLQGTPNRHEGLDGWPEGAFSRKVVHEVTLMESALELCRQGRCVGYFPIFIIDLHNQKYRTDFSLVRHTQPKAGNACTTAVYLVKRKSTGENADAKLVAKLIRMGT